MKRLPLLVRALGVLALGVAPVLAFAPVEAANNASLEIHKRVCHNGPPRVDIFAECHGFPPEQTVRFRVDFSLPKAVNADGNVTFTRLAAGNHTVTEVEGPPLEFVTLRVWCSVPGSGEPAVELETDGPRFTVRLVEGAHTVCDVYNISQDLSGGARAVLEIHKRVCENGPPTTDIFEECHRYPPKQTVRFRVDSGPIKSVDAKGNVRFSGLTPGSKTVTEVEGPPLEFVDLRVWCSVYGSGQPATERPTTDNRFTVTLQAGQYVICDVYNIPEDLSG